MSAGRRVYNLRRHVQHPHQVTDFHARFNAAGGTALPAFVDHRPKCPPVRDQGELGSCTSFAGVGAMQYFHWSFLPSPLFLYYKERQADGDVAQDGGSTLSQCVATLTAGGVCSESLWPYVASRFADLPPKDCTVDAATHKATQTHGVAQTLASMQACLAQGYNILIGITVYSSFESDTVAATGVVPMPDTANDTELGGHALLCVGWTAGGHFIVRNSWGPDWGAAGYCYIPFAYLLNADLASDFHAITAVSVH